MAVTTKRTGDIQVTGLAELSRALKGLDKGLAKELRLANKEVATDVVRGATGRGLALGGVAAKTAPTLKVAAGQSSAAVVLDAATYPWAGGAEFGGQRRSTTMQFQPWRGAGPDAGYFVYPEIREGSDERAATYEERVDRLLKRAFPD